MKTLRWKVWLAAFALFAAGTAAGALVTVGVAGRIVRKAFDSPAVVQGVIINRAINQLESDLTRELRLDPAQVAQIRRELSVTTTQLNQLRSDTSQNLKHVFDDTLRRLSPTLTATQRTELAAFAEPRFARFGLRFSSITPVPADPR